MAKALKKLKVNNASIALEKLAGKKQDLESYTENINMWSSRRAPMEMSMLLFEILLSRKPRSRPADWGANSFYNRAVLNSYTLLKRTKGDVLSEFVQISDSANPCK